MIFFYDIYRLGYVYGFIVRLGVRRFGMFVMRGMCYKDGLAAGSLTGLDVTAAVADDPGPGKVNVHFVGGGKQHSRVRLSAVAFFTVFLDGAFGMIRAVVDTVEGGVFFGQQLIQSVVYLAEELFCYDSVSNGGLVGDNNELVSHIPQFNKGLSGAIQENYLVGIVDVAGVFYQGVVTVQKYSFIRHISPNLL